MEVKPGYKQTEVGVIPEEWDVRSTRQMSASFTRQRCQTATIIRTDSTYCEHQRHVRWLERFETVIDVDDQSIAYSS